MNILINNALTRTYTNERGNRQVVYFTLTDGNGTAYNCVDDLSAEVDAQEYLDANIENELLFVRQEEYPVRPVISTSQEQSALEAFEQWISDGCLIVTGKDQDGNDITKQAEKKTWRPRF